MKRKKPSSLPKKTLAFMLVMMVFCLGGTFSFAEQTLPGVSRVPTDTTTTDQDTDTSGETPGTVTPPRVPSNPDRDTDTDGDTDGINPDVEPDPDKTTDDGTVTDDSDKDKEDKKDDSDKDKEDKKTDSDKDKDDKKDEKKDDPVIDPEDAVVKITAKKTLSGKTLKKDEFSFVLISCTDDTIQKTVAKNDEKGNISFGELKFEEPGSYEFKVREDTSVKEKGVTYDKTVYTVLVNVTLDTETQQLATEIIYKDGEGEKTVKGITFANSYKSTESVDKEDTEKGGFINTGDATPILILIALFILFALILGAVIIIILKRKNGDQNRY